MRYSLFESLPFASVFLADLLVVSAGKKEMSWKALKNNTQNNI